MDLKKVFETKNHDLWEAKLRAYELSSQALSKLRSWFSNLRQED